MRILALMTAAVSVGQFQPETLTCSTCLSSLGKRMPRQVGRRSEEGLIEHTQHSPPCRRNCDESYYSPAMVPWRGPSGRLFAVLPDSLYMGVILMRITYTDNGAAGAHSRMPV